MRPALHHFGTSGEPVVVVDAFTAALPGIVDIAAALTPYPDAGGSQYPGVRRIIAAGDADAHAYATRVLEAAAPFIGGAFGFAAFDWIEASFSIVTARPADLVPAQRAPHFDATDPGYLAILHYLSDTPGSGTAFYRHRATGIERVTAANRDRFIAAARRESATLSGYTNDSNAAFERIGLVEAVPDRLVLYRGCLLHSGVIPADMPLSANPRRGRLTANLFVQGRFA